MFGVSLIFWKQIKNCIQMVDIHFKANSAHAQLDKMLSQVSPCWLWTKFAGKVCHCMHGQRCNFCYCFHLHLLPWTSLLTLCTAQNLHFSVLHKIYRHKVINGNVTQDLPRCSRFLPLWWGISTGLILLNDQLIKGSNL